MTSLQGLVTLTGNDDPNAPLVALLVTIGLLTMLTGIALRYGHWWLFAINFVAVASFLELTSFTVQGLFSGFDRPARRGRAAGLPPVVRVEAGRPGHRPRGRPG